MLWQNQRFQRAENGINTMIAISNALRTKAILVLCAMVLTACAAPEEQTTRPESVQPELTNKHLITSDNTKLPMRAWIPESEPEAVIIGLHGFNDYSHSFEGVGEFLGRRRIAFYAYDQRGFGAAPNTGIWAGEDNLIRDMKQMVAVIQEKYPGVPTYVVGESMGAAVAINSCAKLGCDELDGLIFIAPAVWGEESFNQFYRFALWCMAHMFPSSEFTGEDVEIQATDNIPLLIEMGKDPLVIKKTRVDAIYGIVGLMDDAFVNIAKVKRPVLLLYGAKDEVIPLASVRQAIDKLTTSHTVAYYPKGYHMLLRDLQAKLVMKDIKTWIKDRYKPLDSGFDMGWREKMLLGGADKAPELAKEK